MSRTPVHLITYVNRFGGTTLKDLDQLLGGDLQGLFAGVHLLPFYNAIDGADAGYDPVDHGAVDQRLGSWDDVRALSDRQPIMADLIVNHISAQSSQFQDFLKQGSASPCAGMFGLVPRLIESGWDTSDVDKVAHPGGGNPLHSVRLHSGEEVWLWNSFSRDQIDIDVASEAGWGYLLTVLDQLKAGGITFVRLDAVGFTVKTPGTSCFMTPETLTFIEKLADEVRIRGMQSVLEIHGHDRHIQSGATVADWVYDFALPPLVLHGLFACDFAPLATWLERRPDNCLTVLDTHDGIGVEDAGPDPHDPNEAGLLTAAQTKAMIQRIHHNTGGVSAAASGKGAQNLDVSQINCTFYDAFGRDEPQYLMARLIQLFAPGIPQIYYVGLLADENDTALLERTGVGRDINRHYYSLRDIELKRRKPVAQALEKLIRFRNAHPAFGGDCEVALEGADRLEIRRTLGQDWVCVQLDASRRSYRMMWGGPGGEGAVEDLMDLPSFGDAE